VSDPFGVFKPRQNLGEIKRAGWAAQQPRRPIRHFRAGEDFAGMQQDVAIKVPRGAEEEQGRGHGGES
jgi:hypothetical protein